MAGFRFPTRGRNVLLATKLDELHYSSNPLPVGADGYFPVGKLTRTPPYRAEFRKAWSDTFTLPMFLHGVVFRHRGNLYICIFL
jgi:hypothetical protein